ncbi:MAG: carbamoyltransferase C-terminal domain-containing protein [Endomicrobiaceae bacterium]|jgi:carbamoyltransferase|nr:carbamoyltransferase C-terminal domain-containing protein [Endomicrobiaceae bacterium]MDD3729869.1 carbamoyltransferase C-terminal domain-containing protein [Endomicrobiaceae bacterium]MDD4166257.1 carbamoyltransferase C-terminal domain-containing protein [Endomicrobiaceae bacterium]
MKNILGISGGTRPGNQDSAATIISNGEITACAEEERFIRIKHAPGVLPENAIIYCLKQAGLDIKDVDCVVFAGATYDSMKQILTNFFNFKFGYCPDIFLIDHHLAHAASAFYTSGFENSFIITADFSGDNRSTVLWYADKKGIKEIESYLKPNSLGLFYAAVTQYLGFKYDNDECKTMALAGYDSKIASLFNDFLKINNGGYNVNTKYLDSRIMPGKTNPSRQEPLFSEYLIKTLGRSFRKQDEKINDFYLSVAKSAQTSLEKAYFELIKKLRRSHYTSNNLCLAGGVALNAELNSRIAYSDLFSNMFVQPVANDAGLSLGGALYIANKIKSLNIKKMDTLYLGPAFSDRQIKRILLKNKIKYRYYPSGIEEIGGSLLADGKIGAIFNGRMECGPRALGNRSILANPKNPKVKDILNKDFKNRELFQPFAPSVLDEDMHIYFDLPKTKVNLEHMIVNVKVKKEKQKDIISAVHINNTARIQNVKKNINPVFYKILSSFRRKTSTGVLLNTSLNKKGQPIACAPSDALDIFYSTPLDFIIIGKYIVTK